MLLIGFKSYLAAKWILDEVIIPTWHLRCPPEEPSLYSSSKWFEWYCCPHRAKIARTVRWCPTTGLQPDVQVKPENSTSVLSLKEQEDTKDIEVEVDYELVVDYITEGSDPSKKQVAQKEE